MLTVCFDSDPASTTFTSSIDYFDAIARHDLHHLSTQLNSVDDEEDARRKYIYGNVLQQLVSRFVQSDHGPFRLICDDFGPMNMMVNNVDDLEVVAVLDWEWSYAGPSELFWSPPLWLLGQHPVCWEDGVDNSRVSRYHEHLDVLIAVLQEEEAKILPKRPGDELPSVLLRNKQHDGSMWFYHLMHEAYHGPNTVPFSHLRAAVSDFDELAAAVSREETEAFVQMKMKHLQSYAEKLAETKRRYPEWV